MASDTVWTCKSCQLHFTKALATEEHWRIEHQKQVRAEPDGVTVIYSDLTIEAMLGDFLPTYKKQVEQEFAETICQLLELVADGKDQQTRGTDSMPAIVKLNAAADALRDFKDSVRVMADLQPET